MSVEEKFSKLKLITQKLHGMHLGKADVDALESEGMSRYDVYRLRRVMDRKIKQLTENSIDLIEAL